MKKLMKNKKGFTLMEMLIVVAIIVILVAISIPVFTSQLDKAKQATDEANLRAAKGAAYTEYLTDGLTDGTYYYDAEKGDIVSGTKPTGYGQSSAYSGEVVVITVDGDAAEPILVQWESDVTP